MILLLGSQISGLLLLHGPSHRLLNNLLYQPHIEFPEIWILCLEKEPNRYISTRLGTQHQHIRILLEEHSTMYVIFYQERSLYDRKQTHLKSRNALSRRIIFVV